MYVDILSDETDLEEEGVDKNLLVAETQSFTEGYNVSYCCNRINSLPST